MERFIRHADTHFVQMNANDHKKRYLFERIGVYAILLLVLALCALVISVLPYENTYIRESGVNEGYLDSFVLMAVVAVAILILGTFYNVMLWMEGRVSEGEAEAPRSRKLVLSTKKLLKAVFSRDFGRQLSVLLLDSVLLRKLWKTSKTRWFLHSAILIGFIGIFALDVVVTIALEVLHSEPFIDPDGWGKLWVRDFGFDFFGLMILIGLIGAAGRRFLIRPKQLVTGQEDIVAVLLLLLVVIGGFVQEGLGMKIGLPSHSSDDIYSFVGAAFAAVLPSVSMETYAQLWLMHAVASLALIAYIPFSKLFHLFAAPLANQIDAIIRRREDRLEG